MRILLSNDDGFDAPGMTALTAAMEPLGETWVIAPSKEHSAQSHALTLHKPLRASHRGERRYAASGTPADCVYLGLHELVPAPVDVVVSGINRGSNLGFDVHYSGTAAAAREAALSGVPAVAISLYIKQFGDSPHWETAQHVAAEVVRRITSGPEAALPRRTFLNVNVPNVPLGELRGIRLTRLGVRLYDSRVTRRTDPYGRPYYWLGGHHASFDVDPDTDGRLCDEGWAVVSPMQVDPTDHPLLATLKETWPDVS